MAQQYVCFCGVPVKTFKNKKDETWTKCGLDVDFKQIFKKLAACKVKDEKKKLLEQTPLGCTFNMLLQNCHHVHENMYSVPPKFHPKCDEHKIYAKMAMSNSENNKERCFLSCAVGFPNHPCNYFRWCDDDKIAKSMAEEYEAFKNKDLHVETDEVDTPPPPKRPKWMTVSPENLTLGVPSIPRLPNSEMFGRPPNT